VGKGLRRESQVKIAHRSSSEYFVSSMVGSASDRRMRPRMNFHKGGLLGRNVVCDTAERGGGVRGSMSGLVLKGGNILVSPEKL
jgi:hypothetical protein